MALAQEQINGGDKKAQGQSMSNQIEHEAQDGGGLGASIRQKQSIHKKNSLSQGLVIQRKKRMINTISTSNNAGLISNSHSYQLSGKQIQGTAKQQNSQEVSPQQNLKANLHLSNKQLRKPGKQFIYSSAPHSPKGHGQSAGAGGQKDVLKGSAPTSQFTTTRTNSQVLSSSHNNIIQKNTNQQQQIQGIYGINSAHASKVSSANNTNNPQASSTGRQVNYLAASHPNVLMAHTGQPADSLSPDFNRQQDGQMPSAYSQREAITNKTETDFQASGIGSMGRLPQGHNRSITQHTAVYLQPHLSRKDRQGYQNVGEIFAVQDGKVVGAAQPVSAGQNLVTSSPQLLPHQLESVPQHNASAASVSMSQNFDRKRQSGPDGLIDSNNLQPSAGIQGYSHHQRKPTIDLTFTKGQKGQTIQYHNQLRQQYKGERIANNSNNNSLNPLRQSQDGSNKLPNSNVSSPGVGQNSLTQPILQRNPRTDLGSRKNSREETRNIGRSTNIVQMGQNEMGTEMLMSFGEQKAKSNVVVAQINQANSKRFKVNGRPCTSSGSGSQLPVKDDGGTISTPFSEVNHNQQRQGMLQDRDQSQVKPKNLTEHSVDRVTGDKRNGQYNQNQNQQLLPHGGRFMTDQNSREDLGASKQTDSVFGNHSLKHMPQIQNVYGKDKLGGTPNQPQGKNADRNLVQSQHFPQQNKIIRRQIISAKSHNQSRDNSLKSSMPGNNNQGGQNASHKHKNALHFRNQTQSLVIGPGLNGQQQSLIGYNKVQQVQLAQRKVGAQPSQNRRKLLHLQQSTHSREPSMSKSLISGRKDDSKLTAETSKGTVPQGSMQQTPKIDEIFQSTHTDVPDVNDTSQTQNQQHNQPNQNVPMVAHFNPLPQKQGAVQQNPKPLPTELLNNDQAQGANIQQLNNQGIRGQTFANQNGQKNASQISSQPQSGKQPKFMQGGNPGTQQNMQIKQNQINKDSSPNNQNTKQPTLTVGNILSQSLPTRKKISKSHNPSGRTTPSAQLKGDNPPQPKENKSNNNAAKKSMHKEGKNCIRKFAFATRVGYHPNNPNKVNQDAYILQPNIQGLPQVHLFGVCDGHGQFGRNVSSFVKVALAQELERRYGMEPLKDDPQCCKQWEQDVNQMPDDDLRNLAQVLKDSFVQVNYDIEDNTPDCKFSGTTCSIVLTRGPQLISANAGDSRAIIVDKDGRARALSRDHKPDTPEEHQRIIARGGRVRPLINQQAGVEMGPARVWLKELEVPGLAMSRSLGDQVAQSVGVSPEPEINIYDIDINDRFIIIASDGVWEFLSNDQVAQMAIPFYAAGHAEQAANTIVREAAKTWKEREDVVDDITCVVVFMDIKLVEKSLKFKETSRLQQAGDQPGNGNDHSKKNSMTTLPQNTSHSPISKHDSQLQNNN